MSRSSSEMGLKLLPTGRPNSILRHLMVLSDTPSISAICTKLNPSSSKVLLPYVIWGSSLSHVTWVSHRTRTCSQPWMFTFLPQRPLNYVVTMVTQNLKQHFYVLNELSSWYMLSTALKTLWQPSAQISSCSARPTLSVQWWRSNWTRMSER